MAEARKRRELLPLIHHHLVQAGYVRAAREVKLQSGQKTFPAQSVTLLDIYTHWQQTSEVAKKRKAEEADGEIPCKVRVSDPTSSSESSEEEKEQQGRVGATVKTTKVLYSNSVSVTKDAQCKNSLSKPKEDAKTKNKKGTCKTVVTSASHPDPLEAQTTSGKPGPTVSVQSPSKKSPATPRKQAAQPPSNSLATQREEKVTSPVVKSVLKSALMPPDKKTESSSEDASSDETDIEMEKATGTPQGNSALVRGDSTASVPPKGSQEKVVAPSPGRLVTEPPTAKEKNPEETSESSDESESDENTPSLQGQKQEVKISRLGKVLGRVGKTTQTTGKTITPSSKPNLELPSKAAKTQKAEESSETSEESESEEEDALLQRQQVKTAPASQTKVSPRKGALPVPDKSVTSNLQAKAAELRSPETSSESSEESESDEEASVPQGQEKSSLKMPQANAIPGNRASAPSNLTTVPVGKGAIQAKTGPSAKAPGFSFPETSSDGSEDSESEEDIIVPQRQEKSSGKAPQANATPAKGTLLAAGKPMTSALQAKTEPSALQANTGPSALQAKKGPSALQAKTGPSAMAVESGSSETSSESSEESESEEEITAPQEKEKSAVKVSQVNAITTKIAPAPTQGPLRKEVLSAPEKSGTLASGVKAPSAAEASGAESSENSEESESEEETPFLQTQGKPSEKTLAKVTPTPPTKSPVEKRALHTAGKTVASAPSAKVVPPATGVGSGGSEESSESSEESGSEADTPASQGQMISSVKTRQVKTSPSPPTKRPLGKGAVPSPRKLVTSASSAKGTSLAKAVGPGKPEESSESSEDTDSEVEVPVSQGQAKPPVKALQTNASSQKSATVTPVSPKSTQGRVSTPAPGKSGTTKAAGPGRPEDTSESSEESESEEENAASQGQAKPTMKAPQVDTPPGKGAPVTPISAKGTQGRVSTAAPWKSGTVPLQAKAAGAGRSEDTSESSEESESEEESPVSQGQAKPTMKAPQVDTPPGKGAPVTPISAKGTQGRVSTAAPWKSGTVPLQAKAAGAGRSEDTSESSEESESEEESPVSQGQAKPVVKPGQADAPSGNVPPQTKGEVQVKAVWLGRPEETSESSEDSEREDSISVSQDQVKPMVTASRSLEGKKGTTISSPKKSAVASLQASMVDSSSSDDSSSSSDDVFIPASQRQVKPSVQTPQGKAAEKPAVHLTTVEETSSESEDTESEEEGIPALQGQVKGAVKSTQVNTASGRENKSTPASGKSMPSSKTTITGPIKPQEHSDSNEESESEDEVILAPQGQVKPAVKIPEIATASARKKEPTPASGKSVTPSPQTQVGPQAKVIETVVLEESSDASDDSDGEVVIPVRQEQVSSGKKNEKAGTAKNDVGKVSAASPYKQLASPDATKNQKSKSNSGELPTAQVIKTPLIFIDPNGSPGGKAAVPMKTRTVSRKKQVSESREQSSSESEDDGVIPDTQHPTLPTIKTILTGVTPICQKASSPLSTSQPEANIEESSSASDNQETGTSQTTCVKSKTAKQDKKSKVAGRSQAMAAQDGFSVTTSNGTKNEKEDLDTVKAKQTHNLGLFPKGNASVNTEGPEDSSEEEMIEPSQSILSAYAFPSSSLPVSINPQLQKAPAKQRVGAVASAGPVLPASSEGNPQSDSSDSEAECKTEPVQQPPPTGKELKTLVSIRQAIREEFKPGTVNCKSTSSKHGIHCQSPIKSVDPSNLSADENSELNHAFLNSKDSEMRMPSDLPQLEKKKKSTKSQKSGKGSKKSKSKRKLTEDSPVTKDPKSKKKKLMGEVPEEGETLKEKTAGTPKVGKKEKGSGDAKGRKPKGVHSPKKNKEKPEGNSTVTVEESGETLGTKTKKEKKQKKKSDKKKKDKDKKDKKKKKSISKTPDPASIDLKKEKKKKKKIKQVD
ncbi:treacle protein isoform X2 [Notamacropus eugenii]|uniref:treacle protein isoform X2 n=1 Tax=Notamacropus eugenii TaxID=9315 RepID=UPI003B67E684